MEALIHCRIKELLTFRRWYRQNRWATWTDLRREHETELRALVRLAREARRLDAAKPDPITEAKAYDYHAYQAAGPR